MIHVNSRRKFFPAIVANSLAQFMRHMRNFNARAFPFPGDMRFVSCHPHQSSSPPFRQNDPPREPNFARQQTPQTESRPAPDHRPLDASSAAASTTHPHAMRHYTISFPVPHPPAAPGRPPEGAPIPQALHRPRVPGTMSRNRPPRIRVAQHKIPASSAKGQFRFPEIPLPAEIVLPSADDPLCPEIPPRNG